MAQPCVWDRSAFFVLGFFSFITAKLCSSVINLSTCFFSTFDSAIPIDRFTRLLRYFTKSGNLSILRHIHSSLRYRTIWDSKVLMVRPENAAFVPLNDLFWCIPTLLQNPQSLDLDRSKFCWDVLSDNYLTRQLDQRQMSVTSVVPLSRHLHRLVKILHHHLAWQFKQRPCTKYC